MGRRYALKRMKKKFKSMQKDVEGQDLDWRQAYLEARKKELLEASSVAASAPAMSQKQLDDWDIERRERLRKKK